MWTDGRSLAGLAVFVTGCGWLGGSAGPAAGPSGTIVVHRNAPGAAPTLCRVPAAGGALTCDDQVGRFAGPAAPDGRLAIVEVVDDELGHRERLVTRAAASIGSGAPDATAVTPWATQVRDPAWAPDGSELAVTSAQDGISVLYRLDPTGTGEPAPVHPHPLGTFEPAWSPDGTTLAFASSRAGHADLFVLDVARDRITAVTNDVEDDLRPRWSTAGDLAWIAARDGVRSTWIHRRAPTPDQGPQRLRPDSQDQVVDLAWAPTDRRLAVACGPTPDAVRIDIVDAETGRRKTTFGDATTTAEQPAWSPDGHHLAFTCRARGAADALPAVCVGDVATGTWAIVARSDEHEVWLPRWVR